MWQTTTRILALKERFLQLMCGSEDSESKPYDHVINKWDLNDIESSDYELAETNVVRKECCSERDAGEETCIRRGSRTIKNPLNVEWRSGK